MLARIVCLAVAFAMGTSSAFAEPVGPYRTLAIKFENTGSTETLFVRKTADSRITFEKCVRGDCSSVGRPSGYTFEEIQNLRRTNRIKSGLFKTLVHGPVSLCAGLLGGAVTAAIPLAVGVGLAGGASDMGAGLFSLVFAGAGYILAFPAWLGGSLGSMAVVAELISSTFSTDNRFYGPNQLTASTEYLEAPQGFWKVVILLPSIESPESYVGHQYNRSQRDLFEDQRNPLNKDIVVTVTGASEKVIDHLEQSLKRIDD